MDERQRPHHLALMAVAREYTRIRAGLVREREEALLQALNIARVIEVVDHESLVVFEALRELEGDEEFIAS